MRLEDPRLRGVTVQLCRRAEYGRAKNLGEYFEYYAQDLYV